MKGLIFSDPGLYCRSRWSDWSKGPKEKRDHFSILGERSSGNNLIHGSWCYCVQWKGYHEENSEDS